MTELDQGIIKKQRQLNEEPTSIDETHRNLDAIQQETTRKQNNGNTRRRLTNSGLTFEDLPSSIPPPVPESLPTTPGFELTQRMFEKSLISSEQNIPEQRPPLKKQDSLFNRLLNANKQVDENVMSLHNPPKNFYRVIGACLWNFMIGTQDGSLGALLPHIEAHYGISYGVVSLIWLGNALGYIFIAFTAHHIDNFIGRHKMVVLSIAFFLIMFSITLSGTKFPAICVGFFFAGCGGAIGLSFFNIFLSKLKDSSKYLGYMHGCYGTGAFVAPLIGTAMINHGLKWNLYFIIPLSLAAFNLIFLFIAFAGCDEDLAQWEFIENDDVQTPPATNGPVTPRPNRQDVELEIMRETTPVEEPVDYVNRVASHKKVEESERHNFVEAMQDYRTYLTSAFIFFYQGGEVAIGGWIVTFLLEYRGGNAKAVGYVASGYWGGITLGRFVLTHFLTQRFGVRRPIIVLCLLIIVFDILTWFIPNTIAAAIFVSLVGVCVGPVIPMMVALVTRILPRKIRFCALTIATAFGSSGGSAVPFAVGMASQYAGTYILHPIIIISFASVIISWILQPNIERKGAITNIWQRYW